ncbi:MAG: hypothetical protein WD266_11510 [Balneolales bacterium]
MESLPRAFAYTSAALLIGVIVYMFTQNIIQYVNQPGLAGIVFSLGFLLFYLNINYLLGKRFTRRTIDMENFPYMMSIFLILPALALSVMTGRFLTSWHQAFYILIIFMGSLLGASMGIKKGLKIRKQAYKESFNHPDIPEDLRSAKERLSNN